MSAENVFSNMSQAVIETCHSHLIHWIKDHLSDCGLCQKKKKPVNSLAGSLNGELLAANSS